MRKLLKWAALAIIAAMTLIIARDPPSWQARVLTSLFGTSELPASFYTPRATVPGSNQPPPPRESPATELLDANALQSAADYALAHKSRALVVTRHGYIVFERYWQGSNLETVVNSQGLGRVIAALATGAAISERKIGWPDEPLGYLLPEWSRDPRGAITVRNLLQLSSGLDSGRSLVALPGRSWRDQSVDSDLLAETLQRATGTPYAEYASRSIWRRIGAGDASIWLGRGGQPHADDGFFARQGDWLRVGELFLQKGNYQGDEILTPRWVPELLRPTKANPGFGSYVRLSTFTATAQYATNDVFVIEGRGNRLWLVPSLQLAILRTGGPPDPDWDEARIPNLIIRSARDYVPPAARPGADLRQLVPNH